MITEVMHLFYAMDLYEAREAQLDEDEIIAPHVFSIDQVEEMIQNGTIEDAKTILAFLYLKSYKDKLL